MDLFFKDPNEIPLPPEEVRIGEFRAEPYPDGRRVRIFAEVDPFQTRPSLEVMIVNAAGEVVAQSIIVESMTRQMEITMHLRMPDPRGEYSASATLFFTPPISEEATELPERTVVDKASVQFSVISDQ